jgi:hypothetical protein
MAAGGIVPSLDVAEDYHPGLGLRCEAAPSQQLAFQCGEEAFAHGVVVSVTDRSHEWAHTGFRAAAAERQRCILGASVGVVDDIARFALTNRHLQCRQDQLGPQMRLHRPADDPTAERIEHDSQIQEAGRRRDIGDVGDPKLVGTVGAKFRSTRSGAGRALRPRRVSGGG